MPAPRGEHISSAARVLSALEAAELACTALALPATWVLTVEAPTGQLAITPRSERRRFFRSWVALPDERRIVREPLHLAPVRVRRRHR